MSCALSMRDIVGWAVLAGILFLMGVTVIGCFREGKQAGKYDGR